MYFNFRQFSVLMWNNENEGITNVVLQTKIRFEGKNAELMKSINALREERFGINSLPRLIYMADEADYGKTAILAVFDRKTFELVKMSAVSVRTGQNRINKLRESYKAIVSSTNQNQIGIQQSLKEAANN